MCIYKEDFYSVDQFHGSPFHNNRGPACHKAHTNFVNESACVTADKIWNSVVTIHRSQEVKMLTLYMYIFHNCFIKNRGTRISLALTAHQTLSLDGARLHGLGVDSINSSNDYFAYLCIPASETTLH
jgi:hypothetical protein